MFTKDIMIITDYVRKNLEYTKNNNLLDKKVNV